MWELDCEEGWVPKNWCFWTVVLEKTLESPLDCKEIQHSEGDQPWDFFGRNDAKAENSSTLATSCEELTHWKSLWCWEGLGAGGEGDNRGWDGWMASLTRWTWVWVNSGIWWWTGRPGVLWFMGSQRVGHDWVTELNWMYVLGQMLTPDAKTWILEKMLLLEMNGLNIKQGQEEKGTTEDEMFGWHHWLDGHGFGWTLGVGDGQGGLECCSSWGCKELDMTEQLN